LTYHPRDNPFDKENWEICKSNGFPMYPKKIAHT
jgi:hypothetical protein